MPQHTTRPLRMSLLAAPLVGALLLSGCAGDPEPASSDSEGTALAGFSFMIPRSNDEEDHWQRTVEAYTAETGVQIEVIEYPGEAYNTQLSTQLQAGNAADVMILSPGRGQVTSVLPLAEEGFLEPLDASTEALISDSDRLLFEVDGSVYAQPAALSPVGVLWNGAAGAEVGVPKFPASFDDLLDACVSARDGGKHFLALGGAAIPNAGVLAQLIAAAHVYGDEPDWNQKRNDDEVTFAGSAGWLQSLNDIVTMNEQGCFQDGAAGAGFDVITANFSSGSALSAAIPGAGTALAEAGGLTLTANAFPASAGEDPILLASPNYAWGLNAAASDDVKTSVKAFLAWVAQPEQAVAFADASGYLPIVGGSADTIPDVFQPLAGLLDSGSYIPMPNTGWPNPAVYDALGVGVQGLLTGQRTPEQVLTEMDNLW